MKKKNAPAPVDPLAHVRALVRAGLAETFAARIASGEWTLEGRQAPAPVRRYLS